MFGLGPIPAIRQAPDRAGWKIGDIERIEINEAFAAIRHCVDTRAGSSRGYRERRRRHHRARSSDRCDGAVLTTRLLHSMKRDGIERGVVTLCMGGGHGIALALEAMN